MINFPYHKNTQDNYFPIVRLTAYYKNYIARTSALIDSGASISVFNPEVSQQLHLNIYEGKEIFLGGIGGRIKGYIHNVKLEVANKILTVPIVFSNEYGVSFNLLGRDGVFEHFKILFDEKKLKVVFG